MTHPEDLLSAYVDGTLPERERAAVDVHFQACARCREEADLATRATAALSELEEEPVPFGVTGPVLEAARKALPRREPVWARLQWAVGVAAAAVLVLVAVVLLPQVTGSRNDEGGVALTAPAEQGGSDAVTEGALGPMPGLERLEEDLDERDIARLAKDAATASRSMSPTEPIEDLLPPDDAVSCLVASGATIDEENALVRVLEASYLGTPAYLGIFHEGPGGGRPPETAVVWVVSSSDCTILTLFSRSI